jgi:hypothetical protein
VREVGGGFWQTIQRVFNTERTVGTIRPKGGRRRHEAGRFNWRIHVIGWRRFEVRRKKKEVRRGRWEMGDGGAALALDPNLTLGSVITGLSWAANMEF